MKLISANKLNRLWKNGVVAKMVAKTNVLKTTEAVAANTNAENVASALVVGKLINNLKGFTPVVDSTGKITGYKTDVGGAGTVFPFSCGIVKEDEEIAISTESFTGIITFPLSKPFDVKCIKNDAINHVGTTYHILEVYQSDKWNACVAGQTYKNCSSLRIRNSGTSMGLDRGVIFTLSSSD